MQRRFALLDDDATVAQGDHAVAIEVQGEQTFGGTDRIGAVDDNDVETSGHRITYPLDTIAKEEVGAWISVGFA